MFDRDPSAALRPASLAYYGYGGWRFSGARSASAATSGRVILGGHANRCHDRSPLR